MALSPDREGRLTASWHPEALGYGYNSPAKNWRRWHKLEQPDERQMAAMAWGTAHEGDAVAAFEAATGTIVDCSGDDQLWTPYEDWSGCTTDGLIEDNGLIECKAPRQMPSTPKEGYWIQTQSQLHITQRQVGYLVIWTPEETGIWMTTRDSEYWPKVEPSLKLFWLMLKGDKPPGRTKKNQVSTLAFNWERIK